MRTAEAEGQGTRRRKGDDERLRMAMDVSNKEKRFGEISQCSCIARTRNGLGGGGDDGGRGGPPEEKGKTSVDDSEAEPSGSECNAVMAVVVGGVGGGVGGGGGTGEETGGVRNASIPIQKASPPLDRQHTSCNAGNHTPWFSHSPGESSGDRKGEEETGSAAVGDAKVFPDASLPSRSLSFASMPCGGECRSSPIPTSPAFPADVGMDVHDASDPTTAAVAAVVGAKDNTRGSRVLSTPAEEDCHSRSNAGQVAEAANHHEGGGGEEEGGNNTVRARRVSIP